MMRKQIVSAIAFGSCLWGALAFAQDAPAPAAASDASPSTSGDDVIHLHMPVHHRAHPTAMPDESAAPAENPTIDAIGAEPPPPAAGKARAPAASETAPPLSQAETRAKPAKAAHSSVQKTAPTIPFSFGEDSGTGSGAAAPPGNPEPQASAARRETKKTASLPPGAGIAKETPPAVKPAREASRAKGDEQTGLTKRGAVLFDKGVSNPSPSQFQGVKLLAGEVSTALESGASRVQLEAYGGASGDKSSDARRLSLRRALAVRQLLIDSGIPSDRIDVRAMGGAEDKGPNDRVDVFVRAS